MRELTTLCNDKMVSAARDLAEFTKVGIHAQDIVSLAVKCEQLEQQLGKPHAISTELLSLASEIRSALIHICRAGLRIWQQSPKRRDDYQLPPHVLSGKIAASLPRVDVA